jgi:hypothetical protein
LKNRALFPETRTMKPSSGPGDGRFSIRRIKAAVSLAGQMV